MRDSWTDDRLDEFAARTEQRFDRLEARMEARFDKVDERFERIDERFERIDERFEGLHMLIHKTMVQLSVVLVGTVALGFAGIVATQLLD